MKKILALALGMALLLTAGAGCSKRAYRTVKEIQSSKELIVLTNATFEPYEYVAGGQVVGADMDFAQLIADELGVTLKIVDMDFDLLVEALKSGKGDLIAAGMGAKPDRAKQVDFSHVYVQNGLLIIVPAGSEIKGPADLAGLRVSVQEGTTADDYVTDMEPAAGEVLRFKDAIAAGTSVSSGKADACVLDIKPAEGVVANSGGALALLPDRLESEEMCMAVGKGNSELLTIVNKVLAAAVADGTVDAVVQKHMDLTTIS
jgi:polar amino acid transport system substrate-binding protein